MTEQNSDGKSDQKRDLTARARAHRVDTIQRSVDILRAQADERARSIDSKSAFLAVAAGVVITAVTASTTPIPLAVLPLALAGLAVLAAAIALLPGRRRELSPAILVARWVDSSASPAAVEEIILSAKAEMHTLQEESLRRRAAVSTTGFGLLFLAVASLIILYATTIIRIGN